MQINSCIVHPQPQVVHTSSNVKVARRHKSVQLKGPAAAPAAATDTATRTAEGKAPMQQSATSEAEAAAAAA